MTFSTSLLNKILSLPIITNFKSVPKELASKIREFTTKNVDKENLDAIKSHILNENIDIDTLLRTKFTIPYDSDLISLILKYNSLKKLNVNEFSTIILLEYVSSYINYINSETKEYNDEIFNCLLLLNASTVKNISLECILFYISLIKNEDIEKFVFDSCISYKTIKPMNLYFKNRKTTKEDAEKMLNLIKKAQSIVAKDDVDQLISNLLRLIKECEISSIEILSLIPKPFSESSIHSFATSLRNSIYNSLNDIKIEIPEEKSDVYEVQILNTTEGSYSFNEERIFPNGFKPGNNESILINTDISKHFVGNSPLLNYLKEAFVNNIYFESITVLSLYSYLEQQEITDEMYFKIFTVIVFFVSNSKNDNPTLDSFIPQLFSKKVFNPKITIYSYKGNFDFINSLRCMTIETIVAKSSDTVIDMLEQFSKYPLMTSELFERLILLTSSLSQQMDDNPKLATTMIHILSMYRHIWNEKCDKDAIQLTIHSQFSLLAYLMNNDATNIMLLSMPLFASSFFSFLFDESLQDFTFESIKRFLLVSKEAGEIMMFLNNILSIAVPLHSERSISLFYKSLKMLNSCLSTSFSVHKKLSATMIILIPLVPKMLSQCMKSDSSKELISEAIMFYCHLSAHYEIKSIDANFIIESINIINDEKFNSTLMPKLIQLLSGGLLPNIQPTFIIMQPLAVTIVLRSSFETVELINFGKFLLKLCNFSPTNIQVLSDSLISNDLIEFLDSEKKKENLPVAVIDDFLKVFSTLASLYANSQIVHKFVSLFCPFDDTHVSKYQNSFFTTFQNIILASAKEPESYMYLKDSKFETSVDSLDLDEGVTISFWFNIQCINHDYKPTFIELEFSELTSVRIFAFDSTIFLQQINVDIETTGKLVEGISFQEWHFCCVSLRNGPRRMLAQYTVDCKNTNIITFDLFNEEQDSKMNVIVGDKIEKEVKNPIRITNVGVFPLICDSDMVSLLECGIRNTLEPPQKPVFKVTQFETNPSNGFINVFINECGIEVLLPLFAYNNLKFNSGEPFNFQFESAFLILTSVLQLSEEAQKSFEKAQGFIVLMKLIEDKWVNKFTFKSYVSLCTLMTSLHSEALQMQLFESILTNFDFLMRLDNKLHLKILRYWERNLFQSFPLFAAKFKDTNTLITSLDKYYWLDDIAVQDTVQIRVKRSSTLNVKECRKAILGIILSNASLGFEQENFDTIVSVMISCNAMESQVEFFLLLIRIFNDYPSKITFKLEETHFAFIISYFFMLPDGELQRLSLEAMISAEKNNLITKEYAFNLCYFFIVSYHESIFTKKLFDVLFQRVIESPYLIALLIYSSILLGKEEMKKAISVISKLPIEKIDSIEIWLIILYTLCDEEYKPVVCNYLLKLATDDIIKFFARIYIFFGKYPSLVNKLEDTFTTQLVYYINGGHGDLSEPLYEVCKKIIFFNDNRTSLFNESEEENNEKEFNIRSFIDDINDDIELKRSMFGICLSKDGVWKHKQLALDITDVFVKNQEVEYIPADIILFSFLQRLDASDTITHIAQVENTLMKLDQRERNILITYLKYSMEMKSDGKTSIVNPFVIESDKDFLLKSLFPLKLQITINNTLEKFKKERTHTLEMYNSIINADVNEIVRRFLDLSRRDDFRVLAIRDIGKQKWSHYWSNLSIERGPWYNPKLSKEIKWMRESFGTFCGVPVRFLRNRFLCIADTNNDTEVASYKCIIIKLTEEHEATFIIHDSYIEISSNIHYKFTLANIEAIRLRYNNELCYGIEIFLKNHYSILVKFPETNPIDVVETISKLTNNENIQKFDRFTYFQTTALDIKWINHKVTTFEYLLELNSIFGRSFNSLDSYPVFPDLDHIDSFVYSKNGVIKMLRRLETFKNLNYTEEEFVFTIPEMFCMPEMYEEDGARKVVEMRRRLESPEVDQKIHQWIQMVFGELFQYEHEKRADSVDMIPKHHMQFVHQLGVLPVLAAFVSEKSPTSFVFTAFVNNGSYIESSISIDDPSLNEIRGAMSTNSIFANAPTRNRASTVKSAIVTKKIPIYFTSSTIYPLSLTRCAIVSKSKYLLVEDVQRPAHTARFFLRNNYIKCISSDDKYLVLGCQNASTIIIEGTKILHTIKLYRDSVMSCAVSQSFGTVVSGTHDCSLVISDLISGSLVKVVSLGTKRPQAIAITKLYGFIVSATTELEKGNINTVICVHTINGVLLCEKCIGTHSKIHLLQSFSTETQDYIAICRRGSIMVYDCVNLELKAKIGTSSHVLAICYSQERSLLNIITKFGEFHSICLDLEK